MNYTLIGSVTSPFTRRIQLLMADIPYEFKVINIFESAEALALNKINPTNQIPVLLNDEKTIWDSRQIFNYLNSIHHLQMMTWEDENTLTAIESAMDSAVALLLMKRSGMNISEPFMYVSRQKERIESVLDYLSPKRGQTNFASWNFTSMTLYCFLDWGIYRSIFDVQDRKPFLDFLKAHKSRPMVGATSLPKV